MTPRYELVRAGDAEFFVTVADNGPVQVGARREALSFDGVRETLLAVAEQVVSVWRQVRPDEATVEFGLSASAQTGKLTGLVVDGGAQAAFKVTMTWRAGGEQPPPPQVPPVDQSAGGEEEDKAQEVTGGE